MFNLFPSFLGKIKEPLTLVDVGTQNIKVVSLDGNSRIQRLDCLPVPAVETGLENLPKSKEFIVIESIRRLFLKNKNLPTTVYSVLSDRTAFIRVIKLFPMSPKETEKAIRYEAKLQVPFSMESAQLNYFMMGSTVEKNAKKNEILLVIVPQDVIDNHRNSFEKSELKLKVLDLNCLSFWRLFVANYPHLLNKTVAVIDMGASKSEVNIISRGNLCFSRVLPLGSADYSRAIKEELDVSLEEAETTKIEMASAHRVLWGLEEGREQVAERIYSTLSPLFFQFINDLRRSFELYLSQSPASPVEQVILTGGGSNLKEIEEFISENLNRTPVAKFKINGELDLSSGLDRNSLDLLKNQATLQLFTPLLGLVNWGQSRAMINLVASSARRDTSGKKRLDMSQLLADPIIKWFLFSAIGLLLVGLLLLLFFSRLEKNFELKLQNQLKTSETLTGKKASQNNPEHLQKLADIRALEQLVSVRSVPLNELVEAVSRPLSGKILLNKMSFNYGLKQVEITGLAAASESVSFFMEGLSREKRLRKLELIYIRGTSTEKKFDKEFKILGEFY